MNEIVLAKDKAALQIDRDIRLRGALKKAGLIDRLDLAAFWSDKERAVELAAFAEADKIYEADKLALRDALKSLSGNDLQAWLAEHGLPTDTDIAAYLPVSPVGL